MLPTATTFLLLVGQAVTPVIAETPPLPTWGWGVIVGALSSTVVTLATLYQRARDREVAAEQSKVAFVERMGEKTTGLLERAILVFEQNRNGNEKVADQIEALIAEVRALQAKIHHDD